MKKDYILDTNILIDSEKSIEELRNGVENNIFIPNTVLIELDKLKRDPNLKFQVSKVVKELNHHSDYINILYTDKYTSDVMDDRILDEIKHNMNIFTSPVFVTNDELFKFKVTKQNIVCENYKKSKPFDNEKEINDGFVEQYTEEGKREKYPNNTFFFNEKGKLQFYSGIRNKIENVDDSPVWKITPWDYYQKSLIKLLMDDDILVTNVSGAAGSGKSLIACAIALHKMLQEKKYKKIYVVTSNVEATKELGYLPGTLDEKFKPFIRHIEKLFIKLHHIRPANKIFLNTEENDYDLKFNPKYVEFLPLNYLRGETLENCVIISEESQNMNKTEIKTLMTRCGDSVKFISTGDPGQVDSKYLDKHNNGMNWMIKYLDGDKRFANLIMKGKKARGPICEMVNERFK